MSASVPLPASALVTGAPERASTVTDRKAARHERVRAELWTSRGTTKVIGEVDVGRADLRGSVAVGGSLRAERVTAYGWLEVVGAVEVRALLGVDGELRAGSTVRAGEGIVRGSLRSAGALLVDAGLRVVGAVRCPSIAAVTLTLEGDLEIPGMLRASIVSLALRDGSRLGSVAGATVRVRARAPGGVASLLGRPPTVEIGRIEADHVEIEGVDVGFVHANEVVLGPGAHVTTLEGRVVRQHRSSRVGPESRTAPPPGLSR